MKKKVIRGKKYDLKLIYEKIKIKIKSREEEWRVERSGLLKAK